MFEQIESKIPGCFEIIFKKLDDKRGSFTKTYHEDVFKAIKAEFKVKEEYFTHSYKNVFRGLHFQQPPKALDKLVFCVTGRVTDYLVDLRMGSPMYGQWTSFELDGSIPKAIFAPVGVAHGFYVHSQEAILQYKVSEIYDALSDAGISYTSFSFAKELTNPIISERDAAFVDFDNYKSPFKFD
jgi:dTDP-4-dehydrorhamnose 3,5-epimerase